MLALNMLFLMVLDVIVSPSNHKDVASNQSEYYSGLQFRQRQDCTKIKDKTTYKYMYTFINFTCFFKLRIVFKCIYLYVHTDCCTRLIPLRATTKRDQLFRTERRSHTTPPSNLLTIIPSGCLRISGPRETETSPSSIASITNRLFTARSSGSHNVMAHSTRQRSASSRAAGQTGFKLEQMWHVLAHVVRVT